MVKRVPVQSAPRKISIAERRAAALRLRKKGATLEAVAAEIAQEFGLPKYDKSSAFRDIDIGLQELNQQCIHAAAELRQLEAERLDSYLKSLALRIERGDVNAVGTAVKISESRRKLLGLDAPVQLQVEELVHGELDALLTSLESLLPREIYEQVLAAIAQIGERATNT